MCATRKVGRGPRRPAACSAAQMWPCLSLVTGLGAFALTEILSFRAGIQPFYTVLGGIYAFVGVLAIAKSLQSLLESFARKTDVLPRGGGEVRYGGTSGEAAVGQGRIVSGRTRRPFGPVQGRSEAGSVRPEPESVVAGSRGEAAGGEVKWGK